MRVIQKSQRHSADSTVVPPAWDGTEAIAAPAEAEDAALEEAVEYVLADCFFGLS